MGKGKSAARESRGVGESVTREAHSNSISRYSSTVPLQGSLAGSDRVAAVQAVFARVAAACV